MVGSQPRGVENLNSNSGPSGTKPFGLVRISDDRSAVALCDAASVGGWMFRRSSRLAGNDAQRWPGIRVVVEVLHAVMLVEMCDRFLTNGFGGIPGLAVSASGDHMIAHALVHAHTQSSLVSMPAIVAGRVRSRRDVWVCVERTSPSPDPEEEALLEAREAIGVELTGLMKSDP